MEEQTNNSVLDYLMRKFTLPSLVEEFLRFQHGATYHGKTLEHVWDFYIRHADAQENQADTEAACHQHLKIESGPQRGMKIDIMPFHLPELVTRELLSFFTFKERQVMRLVNTSWNNLICHLPPKFRSHKTISFKTDISAFTFIETFQKKVPHAPIPFTKFDFDAENTDVGAILDIVGPATNSATLRFETSTHTPTAVLSALLAKTPQLSELTFHGYLRLTEPWAHTTILPHLRTLVLSTPKSPSLNGSSNANQRELILHWKKIADWFRIAPALEKLVCTSPVRVDSGAEFAQFLLSQKSLQTLSFEELSTSGSDSRGFQLNSLSSKWRHPLALSIGWNNNSHTSVSFFVDALRHSLHDLHLNYDAVNVELREMKQLRSIGIRMRTASGMLFRASSFPALKTVTLNINSVGAVAFRSDRLHNNTFRTVERLNLHWADSSSTNNDFPQWHIIFPALLCLDFTGPVNQALVTYIATNLTKLITLSFRDFQGDKDGYRLCEVRTKINNYQQPTLEWAFSNLTELKHLELESVWRIPEVVADLLQLSIIKVMEPLDTLRLTHVYTLGLHRDKPAPTKPMDIQRLADLNWHKAVKFNFKEISYTEMRFNMWY